MPARPASASPGLAPLHSVVQPCSCTWIGGLFPASEPLHLQFPPPRDPLLKVLCYQVTSSSFRVTFPDHFFDKNWMWSGIILFICFLFIVCLASLNHKLLRAGTCSQPKPQYLERGRHTVVLGPWGWCLLRECDISFARLHWYSFCILTPSHWGFLTWFTALSFISLQLWRGKSPWTVWGRRVCHLPRGLYLPGELHVLGLGKADSVGWSSYICVFRNIFWFQFQKELEILNADFIVNSKYIF